MAEQNQKIEDFGEVLHGARKHNYTFRETFDAEMDIAALPLSKSIPQPDYPKLIEEGLDKKMAAYIAQIRDAIPTKPQKSYKLGRWVQEVEQARDTIGKVLSGEITFDTIKNDHTPSWQRSSEDKFKADILELADGLQPDQVKNLAGLKLSERHYHIFHDEKNVDKFVVTNENDKGFRGIPRESHFDTKDQALAFIKDKAEAENSTEKATKFDIWTTRGKDGVSVGKKISSSKYVELKHFADLKEARQYVAENRAELEAMLKDRKNLREIRRTRNSDRVGDDFRNGVDVTPEQFHEKFGFRGVQFGNWVEGDRRQLDLNNAYDALLDLSKVTGLPPRALSLDGKLGIAFGARGTGGVDAALAHYEPANVVINLTKMNGAGSLAHEWFHAVDNHFGKIENAKIDAYGTEFAARRARIADGYQFRDARPEDFNLDQTVFNAFRNVKDTLANDTQVYQRATNLDAARTKDYWSTTREVTARSFEKYVIDQLAKEGHVNDYLANIYDEEVWQKANEMFGSSQDFAYPLKAEMPVVEKAYSKLFDAIKEQEFERLLSKEEVEAFKLAELEKPAKNVVEADLEAWVDEVNALKAENEQKAANRPMSNMGVENIYAGVEFPEVKEPELTDEERIEQAFLSDENLRHMMNGYTSQQMLDAVPDFMKADVDMAIEDLKKYNYDLEEMNQLYSEGMVSLAQTIDAQQAHEAIAAKEADAAFLANPFPLDKEPVGDKFVVRNVSIENGEVISGDSVTMPLAVGIYQNLPDGTQDHLVDYSLEAIDQVNAVVEQLNKGEIQLGDVITQLERHEMSDAQLYGLSKEIAAQPEPSLAADRLSEATIAATEKPLQSVQGAFVDAKYDNGKFMLEFDGKPSKEVRDFIKSEGFRWNPKDTVWQRFNRQGDENAQVVENIKLLEQGLPIDKDKTQAEPENNQPQAAANVASVENPTNSDLATLNLRLMQEIALLKQENLKLTGASQDWERRFNDMRESKDLNEGAKMDMGMQFAEFQQTAGRIQHEFDAFKTETQKTVDQAEYRIAELETINGDLSQTLKSQEIKIDKLMDLLEKADKSNQLLMSINTTQQKLLDSYQSQHDLQQGKEAATTSRQDVERE